MGLDISIRKKITDIDFSDIDEDFLSKELIYFRKFFPLHHYVIDNCKNIGHSIIDGYILSKEHMRLLIHSCQNVSKKDNVLWDIDWGGDYSESIKLLESFLVVAILTEDTYYYTYVN